MKSSLLEIQNIYYHYLRIQLKIMKYNFHKQKNKIMNFGNLILYDENKQKNI